MRPFMTFTNMIGQDLFVKLNTGDLPKTLCASDWRVSFTYSETGEPNKLQVLYLPLATLFMSFPFQECCSHLRACLV